MRKEEDEAGKRDGGPISGPERQGQLNLCSSLGMSQAVVQHAQNCRLRRIKGER